VEAEVRTPPPFTEADLLEQLVETCARPVDHQGVFAETALQRLERAHSIAEAVVRRRTAAKAAAAKRTTTWAAAVLIALGMIVGPVPASAASVGLSITIGAHARNDAARCVNPVRIGMYAAQAADALTAGAAAQHGGIGRTPFGASPAASYLLEQGALDLVVGALTRRASCGSKNLIDGVIGGSALLNAPQNNSVSR
jgi:hypothetical protein